MANSSQRDRPRPLPLPVALGAVAAPVAGLGAIAHLPVVQGCCFAAAGLLLIGAGVAVTGRNRRGVVDVAPVADIRAIAAGQREAPALEPPAAKAA